MKDNSTVLVLTHDEHSDLIDTLFTLGYVPIIRQNMVSALKEIHHKSAAVVFLDVKFVAIDALEFIINVRDIDQHLPIVILNGSIEGETEILNQQNTFIIARAFDQIEQILNEVS